MKRALLIIEVKCKARVSYTTYPERGRRSDRDGTSSRWTFRSCGLCRKHCELQHMPGRCWVVFSDRKLRNTERVAR